MSTYTLSRITDVNGDNWDIKAKALESQVNIALTGNVTGSATTDLSGNVSIASTIANGAVTTAKIADESITSAKLSTELQTSIGNIHTHSNKNKLDNYSNAGNSSTPVYIAADGTPTACTAADIKAGKDASGNTITSTYATKTEVGDKNNLKGSLLTSSDNVDNLSAPAGGIQYNYWNGSSIPSSVPSDIGTGGGSVQTMARSDGSQLEQNLFPNMFGRTFYYNRRRQGSSGWTEWIKVYYEATSTYSSTGTRAVNGTAVASAIAGKADASNVYTKTEVDDKNWLKAVSLTNSNDLNSLTLSDNSVGYYRWDSSSVPSNAPTNNQSAIMLYRKANANWGEQECYVHPNYYYYYIRKNRNGTWDTTWTKVYYEATSTYSTEGTQAVNGTAVAEALTSLNNNNIGYIGEAGTLTNSGEVATVAFNSRELKCTLVVKTFNVNGNYSGEYTITIYKNVDSGSTSGDLSVEANYVGRGSYGSVGVKYKKEFNSGSSSEGLIHIGVILSGYYSRYRVWKYFTNNVVTLVSATEMDSGFVYATTHRNILSINGTAIGSSSQAVFINSNGIPTAIATADLKAGKDASGNTITSTYATKTELNNKNGLNATSLTASDDLNSLYRSSPGVEYYKWTYADHPLNIPETASDATCLMKLTRKHSANAYCTQEIEVAGTADYYYIRQSINGNWGEWERVYRQPRKSNDVASFTTDDERAYTGKAIAEYVAGAIGGNVGGYMGECSKTDVASHTFKMGDWFVASESGTYTYTVSGTSKTITGVVIGDELYFTTDNELEVKPTTTYEKMANKVTTLDNSNTNYPSTSAVKTYVDNGIANLSSTYETITNVANKNNLKIIEVGIPGSSYATVDLDTLGNERNVSWWFWGSANATNVINRPDNNSQFLKIVKFTSSYCEQLCYPRSQSNFYWKRTNNNGIWDTTWIKVYYEATSTYDATGTRAVNGTAVASAINALDSTKTSTNGTNVQVQVAETDGKISSVSITTDNTENRNNKITAWNSTASTTAYPAESLVVSALANKKNVQTAKTDPTASGTGISYIATITQNANGEITATKSTVRTGTTSQTGVVQLSDTSSSTDSSKAATPKGVWNAINTLDKSDTAVSNQFVTAVSETNGIISVSRAQPTISNVSGLQTALNSKEGSFTISYNSEDHALVFSKAFT